jgi:hypothetical protein
MRGGGRSFFKGGASAPDQFVRTKLSQLEVPEAMRTTRVSASPGISGEVNLASRFEPSTGFFKPMRFFRFPLSARFPERASTLAGSPRGSTGFLNFLFSLSPPFPVAPRSVEVGAGGPVLGTGFSSPRLFGCGAAKVAGTRGRSTGFWKYFPELSFTRFF